MAETTDTISAFSVKHLEKVNSPSIKNSKFIMLNVGSNRHKNKFDFSSIGNHQKGLISPIHRSDSKTSPIQLNEFNLLSCLSPTRGALPTSPTAKNTKELPKNHLTNNSPKKEFMRIRYKINETNYKIGYDTEEDDTVSSSDVPDNIFWGDCNTSRTDNSKLMDIHNGFNGKSFIDYNINLRRKEKEFKNQFQTPKSKFSPQQKEFPEPPTQLKNTPKAGPKYECQKLFSFNNIDTANQPQMKTNMLPQGITLYSYRSQSNVYNQASFRGQTHKVRIFHTKSMMSNLNQKKQ